jgi:hypothetical protein
MVNREWDDNASEQCKVDREAVIWSILHSQGKDLYQSCGGAEG